MIALDIANLQHKVVTKMTRADSSLNAFLKTAAKAARSGTPVRIYLGNEASDLDSMASSVLLAYSRGAVSDGLANVPVMNIPREDFSLRTEAAWLFKDVGIDSKDLVFLDDVDLNQLFDASDSKLVLLDHNKLANAQAAWAGAVEEIIDHHVNENLYPAAKKAIEPTGSATTLVAETLLAVGPANLEADVYALALGTILLDTVNLAPEAKRVTPRDEAVVAQLLDLANRDRNTLFNHLQFEKFNVAALDSRDILRKDYKEYRMGATLCGIASALLSMDDWSKKDTGLDASFAKFCTERKLDVLVVMNAYTAGDFKREMAVHAKDTVLRKRLADCMNQAGLGLTTLLPSAGATDFYAQSDLSQSRKKLQPLLSDCFKN